MQHKSFASQEDLFQFYCGSRPKETGQAKTKTNSAPVMDMPEALTTIPEPHQAHMHCSSHSCLAHDPKLLRKQAISHFKTKSSRRISHVLFPWFHLYSRFRSYVEICPELCFNTKWVIKLKGNKLKEINAARPTLEKEIAQHQCQLWRIFKFSYKVNPSWKGKY